MAKKRMFSLKIVDTDDFLDMPATTQNLYFHLCMRADDDGFVSNPKKIMKIINSADDDIKVLTSKKYVIPFESGVCVIKHWKIHNLIRSDRYTETEYKKEKELLIEQDNKYTLSSGEQDVIPKDNQTATKPQPNRNQTATKPPHRLGKDRLGKVREEKTLVVSSKRKNKKPKVHQLVDYFFELKGWANKDKDFYKKKKIIYGRFTSSSKQLLYLCDDDLHEAKSCLNKIKGWADTRSLGWSIETVFKKWYELDLLKPKEKKPYWRGQRVFEINGKKYVLTHNGEKLEYNGSQDELEWK